MGLFSEAYWRDLSTRSTRLRVDSESGVTEESTLLRKADEGEEVVVAGKKGDYLVGAGGFL